MLSVFTPLVTTTKITWVIIPLRLIYLPPYFFNLFFSVWTFLSKMSLLTFFASEIWAILGFMIKFLTYPARI